MTPIKRKLEFLTFRDYRPQLPPEIDWSYGVVGPYLDPRIALKLTTKPKDFVYLKYAESQANPNLKFHLRSLVLRQT